MLWKLSVLSALALAPLAAGAAAGQSADAALASGTLLVRDPPRGATARALAVRVAERPEIDGVLDEAFWADIEPIRDFVQRDPVDGGVPSERTEVRIAYDDQALYFGFHLFDSDPAGIRATTLQRGGNIGLDDHVVIGLDTFNDRRNGYVFEMNSLGTQDDAIFTDEAIQDWNWDGVYRSEGRVTSEGWVLEVSIPWRTIRFPREQVLDMGLLIYRSIRRKNEQVFWPHLPATYRGHYAQASQYGTLTGVEGVVPGRNVQLKPYLLTGGQKSGPDAPAEEELDVGLDLKYSLTSSLTLDLTYNTDFAQVEADNVQVNLDRFSLFYPEKREFFLERAGLFAFGEAGSTQVFFSRRIGLENPVLGGGRLTGQVGRFSVGLLDLQTRDAEGSPVGGGNSAVARLRADLGPRTTVGGIFTNLEGDGWSRSAGLDAQLRFLGSSSFDVWGARVWDPDLTGPGREGERGPLGGTAAGAATLRVRNARYGVLAGYTNIGRDFLPELGFVRRLDQVRWNGELAFTPRFETSPWARQLSLLLQGEEIDGQDGERQSGRQTLDGYLSFHTGDGAGGAANRRFERLEVPFQIREGTVIPAGDYTFSTLGVRGSTNGTRPVSATTNLSAGSFYDGTRVEARGSVSFRLNEHLLLGTGINHNNVSLPVENGDFTTNVVDFTVKAAPNRFLFADALLQYDDVSERVQANLRLNWIHTPGSNLYLVFNTGYNAGDLLDPRDTRWERRTGVVKLTYLLSL